MVKLSTHIIAGILILGAASIAAPVEAAPHGTSQVGLCTTFVCSTKSPVMVQICPSLDNKYQVLGGAAFFGSAVGPVISGPNGGSYEDFSSGASLYWGAQTCAHLMQGAINEHYRHDLNGPGGLLGYPTTDELAVPDGGRYNTMQGGTIYWSADTGAHEVHGAIQTKYAALGGPAAFGYPTTDETPGPHDGRFNDFAGGGSIYWTADTGAHEVHGAINADYRQQGGGGSCLGYPTSDETAGVLYGHGPARFNTFQYGTLIWTAAGGVQGTVCGTLQGDEAYNPVSD